MMEVKLLPEVFVVYYPQIKAPYLTLTMFVQIKLYDLFEHVIQLFNLNCLYAMVNFQLQYWHSLCPLTKNTKS